MCTVYIGMDIHKNYILAVGVNSKGEEAVRQRFNSKELDRFLKSVSSDVEVAIESTAAWTHIYNVIEARGIKVTLVHVKGTKEKIKTDKLDALKLANGLRAGYLHASYIPTKPVRDLRNMVRHRFSLTAKRTTIKNSVHSILLRNGISHGFSDIFGKAGMEWLKQLELNGTERYRVHSYLNMIEKLNEEINSIDKEIETIAKANSKAMLLTTIPGIDYYAALTIIAEIADINRFSNPKKLCAYAGLVPTVHQSGSHTYYGRIIWDCCRNLKRIMVICAHVHVRCCDSRITKLYRRVKRRSSSNKAIVAAARKMLETIWYMLTRNEEFKEDI
jgi:transposase